MEWEPSDTQTAGGGVSAEGEDTSRGGVPAEGDAQKGDGTEEIGEEGSSSVRKRKSMDTGDASEVNGDKCVGGAKGGEKKRVSGVQAAQASAGSPDTCCPSSNLCSTS